MSSISPLANVHTHRSIWRLMKDKNEKDLIKNIRN